MLTRPLGSRLGESVTPVVLALNEAPNIGRCLERLTWARRVIVLDSGSTDATQELCGRAGNVDFLSRPFDRHADQWNHAIEHTGIKTEWILALDADYILSDAFVQAAEMAICEPSVAGYRCRFRYVVGQRPLRGSLYPPVVALFRRGAGRYVQDGHTQRLLIDGAVRDLDGVIYHDDRKPLGRWFASQAKYAALEAEHLLSSDRAALSRADRVRLMAWPAPILVFLYVLVAKGCLFDGRPGWFYALQRLLAEILLALELSQRRFPGKANSG
jgi:glycosyltransferase involved in cell wall biosynthesis